MKKLLIISLAMLFLGAMALPASAFIFVFGTVEKDKDVYVTEWIDITKDVTIEVRVIKDADKAGESLALVNQENLGNRACDNCAEKRGLIYGSVNGNEGITHANQATGNMNNQGNVVALAVDNPNPGPGPGPGPEPQGDYGFANAEGSVSQNQGFILAPDDWLGRPDDDSWPELELKPNKIESMNIEWRDAEIKNSVNDNYGIVGVNQAPGMMNNQVNSVSMAVSMIGGTALSEADLGQHIGIFNTVLESNSNKNSLIQNSVNDNAGVIGVNQTTGSLANQANNVSIAAALSAN